MKTVTTALAALAFSALAIPAMADDDDDRSRGRGERMSPGAISQKLEGSGYSRITEIESDDDDDDGRYDVDATNRDGRRVDLKVNPRTGEVVRSKRDDDDDDDDRGDD